MIKFFRKIRQNLLKEGKTARYFKYAIGEIILVVVGILIALQINTWYEKQKLKSQEIILLQNFILELDDDLGSLKWNQNIFDKVPISIDRIIKFIDEDSPYDDSLKFDFGTITQTWAPAINQNIFNSLSNNELNFVTNKQLKYEIVSYYAFVEKDFNVVIARYIAIFENANNKIFDSRFNALGNGNYKKYIETNKPEDIEIEMVPNNFKQLKKDKQFLYFIKSLKNHHYWYMQRPLERAVEKADHLKQLINKELQTIKSEK